MQNRQKIGLILLLAVGFYIGSFFLTSNQLIGAVKVDGFQVRPGQAELSYTEQGTPSEKGELLCTAITGVSQLHLNVDEACGSSDFYNAYLRGVCETDEQARRGGYTTASVCVRDRINNYCKQGSFLNNYCLQRGYVSGYSSLLYDCYADIQQYGGSNVLQGTTIMSSAGAVSPYGSYVQSSDLGLEYCFKYNLESYSPSTFNVHLLIGKGDVVAQDPADLSAGSGAVTQITGATSGLASSARNLGITLTSFISSTYSNLMSGVSWLSSTFNSWAFYFERWTH